jgi:DNA-binding transcriptional MerR regulator
MDAYTAGSVARMTQVNARTLDYWSSTGFLIPSVARSVGRRGRRRLYGFADIIAVLVARDLRQSGVSLQGIRRIVAYVQQHWDKNETLAGLRLFVVGKDVSIVTQGEIVSALRRPGQRYLDFSVWDLQGRVESARKAISMEKSSSASERRSVRKSKVA